MIDLVVIFVASFGICFTGAVIPGPLLALTLKESVNRGKAAALWLSGGHSLCELVIVGAIAAGASRMISVDKIVGPVGILGGAIIIWMAVDAFRQAKSVAEPEAIGQDALSESRGLIVGGAVVTVSNPYWLLWWLTVGIALLLNAVEAAGPAGIVSFYVGHISSDFLWFGFIGFLVGRRRQMLSARLYRRIIRACAYFLLGFGALFAVYGVRMVRSGLMN
jgi:threonine/homoserine/homoserine lactone efflux protein